VLLLSRVTFEDLTDHLSHGTVGINHAAKKGMGMTSSKLTLGTVEKLQ
jgi:hypothetical protein